MIKNIIFDFNGTVLDDVKVSFDALNHLCLKYLNKTYSMEYYLDHFSFPVKEFYKEMGFDFNCISYDEVANNFINYYNLHYKECSIYEGIEELILELKNKGITIYLLTASYKELLMDQFKYFKIEKLFDYVICLDNKHAYGKLETARLYFNTNPIKEDETLMIGDTLHDYEVSKSLNIKPILFSKGHNSLRLLKTKSDDVISSQRDIIKYL